MRMKPGSSWITFSDHDLCLYKENWIIRVSARKRKNIVSWYSPLLLEESAEKGGLIKMAKILIFDSENMDEMSVQELIAFITQKAGRYLEQTDVPVSWKNQNELSFPGLQIRMREQTVYLDGVQISLSRYEFFTLCFLAGHPGWVFSKEQIYESVWKEDGENCGTAVTNVISQIRRKLKQENPNGGYIRTVVGSGYKFMPALDDSSNVF